MLNNSLLKFDYAFSIHSIYILYICVYILYIYVYIYKPVSYIPHNKRDLSLSEEKLGVPDNFLSECVTGLNTGRNEEEKSLYTLRFFQNIFRKNYLYVVFSFSVTKLCALLPKPSLITSLIFVNMGDTTGDNICVENSWFRCRKNVNALYFTSC